MKISKQENQFENVPRPADRRGKQIDLANIRRYLTPPVRQ